MGLYLSELEQFDEALKATDLYDLDVLLRRVKTDDKADHTAMLAAATEVPLHQIFLYDSRAELRRLGEHRIRARYRDIIEELELCDTKGIDTATRTLTVLNNLRARGQQLDTEEFWDNYFEVLANPPEHTGPPPKISQRGPTGAHAAPPRRLVPYSEEDFRALSAAAPELPETRGEEATKAPVLSPEAAAYYDSLKIDLATIQRDKELSRFSGRTLTWLFVFVSLTCAILSDNPNIGVLTQVIGLPTGWGIYGAFNAAAQKGNSWLLEAWVYGIFLMPSAILGMASGWSWLIMALFLGLSYIPYKLVTKVAPFEEWNDYIENISRRAGAGNGGGLYRVIRTHAGPPRLVELEPFRGTPNPFPATRLRKDIEHIRLQPGEIMAVTEDGDFAGCPMRTDLDVVLEELDKQNPGGAA